MKSTRNQRQIDEKSRNSRPQSPFSSHCSCLFTRRDLGSTCLYACFYASLQNRRDFLRKQRRKRGVREASAKREWRARGGALKNSACPRTIVQALPAFIYEHGYPIGYLRSRDPRTFLKFNMAVSVDEAIRESLRLFPNVPAVKEKQKKCIEILLKRKDVLGLLPTGFGKSLIIYSLRL